MAIKLPSTTLYTVKEASKHYNIPEQVIYREIKDGRLKPLLRRATVKPYLISDETMEDWLLNGLTTKNEVANA